MQVFSSGTKTPKHHIDVEHSKYCVCHACIAKHVKTGFSVGDRVRIIDDPYLGSSNIGKCGEIEWLANRQVCVLLDDDALATRKSRYFDLTNLEKIS